MEETQAQTQNAGITEATKTTELTSEEQKKVAEITKNININDSQAIIQYGVGAQTKLTEFSDQVLNQIRAKDGGEAGKTLTDLMLKVKELDVDSLSEEGSFFENIPLIGSLINSTKKFMAKYETISAQIEQIVDELHKSRTQLMKDVTLLDGLYGKNLEYYKELTLYILAGEEKLKEINEKLIPEMKAKVEGSNDPLENQKYQDLVQMANRFEKKLHDLKLSKMLSLQTAPQIRLIQNSNQVLVEKIQSSVLNTVPLWKNQIVIALGLFRQKKALELQKEVNKTTNDLLNRNSEMLKTGTIEIAKESEKGIVELETLKKINSDLIHTIDETLRIQAEGSQKRKEAEQEIKKLETELKQKLLEKK